MAKKITAQIKLYCPAGQANPAPPVGPALGQHGVNIMDFCKQFNAKSQGKEGLILPEGESRLRAERKRVVNVVDHDASAADRNHDPLLRQ